MRLDKRYMYTCRCNEVMSSLVAYLTEQGSGVEGVARVAPHLPQEGVQGLGQ